MTTQQRNSYTWKTGRVLRGRTCLHLILFLEKVNDCTNNPGSNGIKTSPSVKMQMNGEAAGFPAPPLWPLSPPVYSSAATDMQNARPGQL